MHRLRSRPALLAVGALLIVAVVLGFLAVSRPGTPDPTATPSPSPTPTASPSPSPSPTPTPSPTPVAVCPLDGTQVDDPALAERTPILVQIENNPIARPPSGLNLADLVIEGPVEGNTTRFSALYMCAETIGAEVGPVRSMRYFNLDHWQQTRALTFVFGGAGAVLNRLTANEMPFVNGISGQWPFYVRAGIWGPPHNVFFDVDEARAQMGEDGSLASLVDRAGEVRAPLVFGDDPDVPVGRGVDSVTFQTAAFWNFGWQWSADAAAWLRLDEGAPNTDAVTGDRISARSVLVQLVRTEVLVGENDPGGYPRTRLFLVGEGDGHLYLDGQQHDVRWSRPSADDVTEWTYAETGDPVVLPPGRTWWEILPLGSAISEH